MTVEPRQDQLRLLAAELDAELDRVVHLVREFDQARSATTDPPCEILIIYAPPPFWSRSARASRSPFGAWR